jgi:hypothetical protein
VRVIVCGSRDWTDREQIANRLFDLPPGSTIVHGAAKGADSIAHQEAEKLGHIVEPHRYQPFIGPDVSPKRAPLVRNEHMASLGADLCIAFWDGRSTGTSDMVDRAEAHGIELDLVVDGAPTRPPPGGPAP